MQYGKGPYKKYGVAFGLRNSVWIEYTLRELKRIKRFKILFEIFRDMFPYHADEDNITIAVVYSYFYPYVEIVWTCGHFEHDNVNDVRNISTFMGIMEYYLKADEVYLAELNSFGETIIIYAYVRLNKLPRKIRDNLRQVLSKT